MYQQPRVEARQEETKQYQQPQQHPAFNPQQYQPVQSYSGGSPSAYHQESYQVNDDQPATNTICIENLTWVS
jgi:hypothetical protein